MVYLIFILSRFLKGIKHSLKDPQFQSLSLFLLFLLTVGTLFYHFFEGWSYLDSLYFSVITLATVGFGDFTPKTPLGKIFTIIYILLGISVLVSFVTISSRNSLSSGIFGKNGKAENEKQQKIKRC